VRSWAPDIGAERYHGGRARRRGAPGLLALEEVRDVERLGGDAEVLVAGRVKLAAPARAGPVSAGRAAGSGGRKAAGDAAGTRRRSTLDAPGDQDFGIPDEVLEIPDFLKGE